MGGAMAILSSKRLTGLSIGILICLILLFVLAWAKERGVIEAEAQPEIGLDIGNLAPDFVLPDIMGNQVRLSAFRGKGVILNFWSTWCKPCIEEMPDMQAFYGKNSAADIEILAVSINRERDSTVKHFVRKLNLTFPVLLDFDKIAARIYKVFALPTSFLINDKGVIVKKWYGKMDLDKEAFLREIRRAAAVSP